jgi:hypothetical protein
MTHTDMGVKSAPDSTACRAALHALHNRFLFFFEDEQ